MLRRLPRRLNRVTGAMEQGRFSLNVRLFADERDRQVVTGLTHQVLLAFLGAVMGIVAALLLGAPGGPGRHRQPLPVDRLQPAHRRQHPRSASAVPDASGTGDAAPPPDQASDAAWSG